MACDDDRIRGEMAIWFQTWTRALQSSGPHDASNSERLVVLNNMSPKTFALRMKMSGKTPLAFTMCHEVVRHRVEVVRNILSTLARADLQCIYNIRLKQVDVLQNILIDPEYRDTCPSAEGYYEEYDGAGSWASLSFSTFNTFSTRTKELEEALNAANASIVAKDNEIAFLQREIERLRAIAMPSTPITNRINGGTIHIQLPPPSANVRMAQQQLQQQQQLQHQQQHQQQQQQQQHTNVPINQTPLMDYTDSLLPDMPANYEDNPFQ